MDPEIRIDKSHILHVQRPAVGDPYVTIGKDGPRLPGVCVIELRSEIHKPSVLKLELVVFTHD